MWTRAELKEQGKKAFKKNYWHGVIVCLIMAFFVGSYMYSLPGSNRMEDTIVGHIERSSNSRIVERTIHFVYKNNFKSVGESISAKSTRGVLALLFNNATKSGSFLFGLLNSLNEIIFKNRIMAGTMILLGAVINFLYWMFVGNLLKVGECRFFLESGTYIKTSARRMLYLYKIRRVLNVAVIMLLKALYLTLWSLTVIGGIIKGYSYRMVPYITAENPSIRTKEVFRLSERMMKGEKWRVFLLDLSFLPWNCLSMLTAGIAGYLFVNPYKGFANAQLYKVLRKKALEEGYQGTEFLNDSYLTAFPDRDRNYEKYPVSLFSIPEYPGRKWLTVDYHRNYQLTSYIMLFFSFGIFGWLWEVFLEMFNSGKFVNRGVLHGPWLPIYGFGGLAALILLKRWVDKPGATFFFMVGISSVIEYVTGWYLETFKGEKWWDYTGYLLNINGRICLEGLLFFGLASCACIYLAAPVLDNLYERLPRKLVILICLVLTILFSLDTVYSNRNPNIGVGVTSIIEMR